MVSWRIEKYRSLGIGLKTSRNWIGAYLELKYISGRLDLGSSSMDFRHVLGLKSKDFKLYIALKLWMKFLKPEFVWQRNQICDLGRCYLPQLVIDKPIFFAFFQTSFPFSFWCFLKSINNNGFLFHLFYFHPKNDVFLTTCCCSNIMVRLNVLHRGSKLNGHLQHSDINRRLAECLTFNTARPFSKRPQTLAVLSVCMVIKLWTSST